MHLPLALLAAAAACGENDPIDPCERDLACAVAGVDIAILDVEPIWSAEQDYDASVDKRVVQPGDEITVEVTVMNRGTIDASLPAELRGYLREVDGVIRDSTTIEPLEVGERATYVLVFEVPTGPRWIRWDPLAPAYEPDGLFVIHASGYVDEDPDNDRRRAGFEFHVDAPVLELTLSGLPDTMRAQTTYEASLHVENHSADRPYAGGVEIVFCATDYATQTCERGESEPFGAITLGPVPAGGARVIPLLLRFDKDALLWFDDPMLTAIAPCLPRAGGALECIHPLGFDPQTDQDVVAMPNIVADCDPPAIGEGIAFDLADGLCAHDVVTPLTFAVARFDAVAGECWSASFVTSSSGSIGMRDAGLLQPLPFDGALDCFRVQRTGTQLLIVDPATPGGIPSGTIVVEIVE